MAERGFFFNALFLLRRRRKRVLRGGESPGKTIQTYSYSFLAWKGGGKLRRERRDIPHASHLSATRKRRGGGKTKRKRKGGGNFALIHHPLLGKKERGEKKNERRWLSTGKEGFSKRGKKQESALFLYLKKEGGARKESYKTSLAVF